VASRVCKRAGHSEILLSAILLDCVAYAYKVVNDFVFSANLRIVFLGPRSLIVRGRASVKNVRFNEMLQKVYSMIVEETRRYVFVDPRLDGAYMNLSHVSWPS
jgi:hypothetical protein